MADPTEAELVDRRSKCGMTLSWFQTKIGTRADKWRVAAKTLGSCYSKAYSTHNKAITDQGEYDKLKSDLCFAVLGAVCVGGLGSLLSTYAKQAGRPEVIAEGVEDTLQTLLGNVFSIQAGQMKPSIKPLRIPPPLEFQNDLETNILKQHIIIKTYINGVREKVIAAEPKKFTNFDEANMKRGLQNYLAKLEQKGSMNTATSLPPEYNATDLTAAIETGIWARWLEPNLHSKVRRRVADPRGNTLQQHMNAKVQVVDVYNKPGTKLEERFNKLGITQTAGIGANFGWWTSESEIKKLLAWGASYQPQRKFG